MAKYTRLLMKKLAKDYTDTFVKESLEENDILKGRKHNAHVDEAEDDDINEATPQYVVDDKYIKDATAALAPLKSLNQTLYTTSVNKLRTWRGKTFTKTAKEYAQSKIDSVDRLQAAADKGIQTVDKDPSMMDQVTQRNMSIAPQNGLKDQKIKSIWVKDMVIDPVDDSKSYADLQLEYVDGSKEDYQFNIGTTGRRGEFANIDRLYKDLARNMPGASDKDIRLSMVRVAFNDYRISWFYGPAKVASASWSFDQQAEKASRSPAVKALKKSWLEQTNRAVAWKSGNTTIYRTESDDQIEESLVKFTRKILSL